MPARPLPRRGSLAAFPVLLLATVAAVAAAGTGRAAADVSIQPAAVAPGDLVTFTVQVANDRAPATTTRVQLDFPKTPGIAYLDAVPVPGWSMRVQKHRVKHAIDTPDGTSGVAISRVVWTGGPLPGAQLVRFTLRIGPVPASTSRVVFTARQTYDSGASVTFNGNPDGSTVSRPKPVLVVSRYAASRAPGTAVAPDAPFNLTEKKAIDRRVRTLIRNGEVATPDDLESARWLAVAAMVVAAAALGFGFGAWAQGRRRAPGPPPDDASTATASAAADAPDGGVSDGGVATSTPASGS